MAHAAPRKNSPSPPAPRTRRSAPNAANSDICGAWVLSSRIQLSGASSQVLSFGEGLRARGGPPLGGLRKLRADYADVEVSKRARGADHQKNTPKKALGTSFLSEHRARCAQSLRSKSSSRADSQIADLRSRICKSANLLAGDHQKETHPKFQNLPSAPHSSPNTVLGCSFGGKGTIHTSHNHSAANHSAHADSQIADLRAHLQSLRSKTHPKIPNLPSAPHSSPNTVLGCSFGRPTPARSHLVGISDLGSRLSRISDLGSCRCEVEV